MKTKSHPTSHDIAAAAGVSQSTVSRVLRGLSNVDADTRTCVLKAAHSLNYRPNAIAQAMRTNRIGVIGVVLARLSNPLYREILTALSDTLSGINMRMVLWDVEGAGEIAAIDAIQQSLIDGVIFAAATRNSSVLTEAIHAQVPLVLINRTVDTLSCDQISSDNTAGAAFVGQYFLQNNRRRIAFITGSNEASTIRDREAGFLKSLADAGRPIDSSLIRRIPFSHQSGRDAMASLLEIAEPPDAVFCVNDLVALGALDAALDRGCPVPERCWVVGFDDVEMASWSTLSLTTARQQVHTICEDGVRMLLERIDDPALPPREIIHKVDLMIRRSTARQSFQPSKKGSRENDYP